VSASTYLDGYGISVQQAHDFIYANLDNPDLIYSTAAQFGVTNEMLGEIAGGYSDDQVRAFFDSHGFVGADLDSAHALLADDMMQLSSLISLNTYGGVLSVSSLRSQVVAQTGLASYEATFNPDVYEGSADGLFTAAELGVSHLGTLTASMDTLESLFYGTLITALKAIDMEEVMDLYSFIEANQDSLANGNEAVMIQFVGLMVSVFADVASEPVFADEDIFEVAVMAGTMMVELVAQTDAALFDGLLAGFLP
jgi:hypothetical protein